VLHTLTAPVSLDMVHEVMGRTAERVGTAEFGKTELPDQHQPAMPPLEWAKHGRSKIVEALDLHEVPPLPVPLPWDSHCNERSTKDERSSIR
jgi:hypothetical protein